jgi:hypothetical protein
VRGCSFTANVWWRVDLSTIITGSQPRISIKGLPDENAIYFFALSPSSTSRLIASERLQSRAFAQASRPASVDGSSRAGIVSLYLMPAGRPRDFLCTVFDCFAMIIRVQEKQARGKRELPPWP